MIHLSRLTTTFLLAGTLTISAQNSTRNYIFDPKLAPREHNVDFKHLRLEASFDPAKGLIKGKVTHVFSPLQEKVDSIYIDGIRIRTKEITINGKPVKYRNDSTGITVYPSSSLTWETTDSMTIVYEANPRSGLYFVGWNDPNNLSRKQIWSQGQGVDNRNWIPMYDEMNDKITSEMIVKFDKNYKVLSNGTKLGVKDNGDGTNTWHYKMTHPHAPYLIMLGIGIYDIKETKSKSGTPLYLYYYPDWKDRVESAYKYSEQMVDFFEQENGIKYPWESYSQLPVQDFMYGAMENTTATVFGDFLFVDERSYLDRYYVGVNAHELAHQWFGDFVTARSDAHHWLQESFATYYNQMFEREVNGKDYFDWARRNANNEAINAAKRDVLPVAHSSSGSTRHYPQGAFVLNMLKYVVGGREAYNKSIKHYLETHPYMNVDSQDLLIAFEETLGLSLDWYWDQWLYRGGLPEYNVKFVEAEGATQITVLQQQALSDVTGLPSAGDLKVDEKPADFVVPKEHVDYRPDGLFKMPIWFEVYYTDGSVDKKMIWIERQAEIVKIPNASKKKIDFVLFDPNNEILKRIVFDKPFEMLKAQAAKAPNMLDRYDALAAMKTIDIEKKRDFLIQQFNKETFHSTKSEIVRQLINDKNPKSLTLIKSATNDKDVIVRKTVINQSKDISQDMLPEMEKLLLDPSYEITASTLEKLAESNPAKIKEYLENTKNVEGAVGRNVRIKWLEIAYNNSQDKKYLDQLIAYSTNSYEFRTRANAMEVLKRAGYFDRAFMETLIEASLSANNRLANPAKGVLNYFCGQAKYKKMVDDYIASKKWADWQKKKLDEL